MRPVTHLEGPAVGLAGAAFTGAFPAGGFEGAGLAGACRTGVGLPGGGFAAAFGGSSAFLSSCESKKSLDPPTYARTLPLMQGPSHLSRDPNYYRNRPIRTDRSIQ